ncbi:hypothetical protein [Nocardia sp. NPDC049707]|uniref:hypothetical protein n=1 Tax=Nocardia sp. NPDC049707 TaxID=3154735 RepID=UPI00343A2658
MTAKDTAAAIRAQLKNQGIKARCRVSPGDKECVQVYTPVFEINFTEDEQRTIRTVAADMGLTKVYGYPIDIERMTDPRQMDFYLPGTFAPRG